MKSTILLGSLVLFGLSACSTNKTHETTNVPTVNNQREIASLVGYCSIEKHPKKNFWRVTIRGKAYNKFWYSQNQASSLKDKIDKQGKCY